MSIPNNLFKVAVAAGDGIGPEIMRACISIFERARVPLQFAPVEMGREVYLSGRSDGMTPEARRIVEESGILFKGPMETPKGNGVKSINVTARKVWNTFANKRTFKSYPGVDTVFSRAGIPIDLTLVRENIEDTYGGIEHMQTNDVGQCRRLITRPGSEQVHRYTFALARSKAAKRVTCGHKANIMKITDGIFLEEFYKVAREYPDIKADDVIVDDLAMKLCSVPHKFEIVVLPNLQGDIISDLCAGLIGGLGMAPSANIGDNVSIFEAVHGTAPDIAGKDIANPTALLLSGVMMLRHLHLNEHANGIHLALEEALKAGERTTDLSPPQTRALTTTQFAEAIMRRLPSGLTERSYASAWPHPLIDRKPITKAILLHSKGRQREREVNVGIDVFVDTHLTPEDCAAAITAQLPAGYTLQMLSNRGTQVWPVGSKLTECVNVFRARLLPQTITDPSKGISGDELLEVAKAVNKAGRVVSLEMLLRIDGKDCFTKAQGQ